MPCAVATCKLFCRMVSCALCCHHMQAFLQDAVLCLMLSSHASFSAGCCPVPYAVITHMHSIVRAACIPIYLLPWETCSLAATAAHCGKL